MSRRFLSSYWIVVLAGLILLMSASPDALAIVDDFSDGNYADGSPLTWAPSLPPFDRGVARIDNDGLVLTPTNERPSTYSWEANYWEYTMVSDEVFPENSTMHIQFRAQADSGTSLTAISLRDTTVDDLHASTSVYGFFYKDAFQHGLRIGYTTGSEPNRYASIDLSPFDEDLHLRLSVVDDTAELTIWRDGEPEPDMPTISSAIPDFIEPMDGRIALTVGSRLDTVPVAYCGSCYARTDLYPTFVAYTSPPESS